jgi:hypothetical protein
MKNILLSVILIASLIACQKENKDSDKIYFTGITKRDAMGNLISNLDTSDWRLDNKWVKKEDDLFSIKYSSSSNQTFTTSVGVYPNPFQDIFCISLYPIPKKSRLAVRLVNKDFKILFKNDSIYGSISVQPPDINGYDTLRLYYKLIDSLNFEYKGHGDILIEK